MDLTLDDADKLRPGDLLFKYRSGKCEGEPLRSYVVLAVEKFDAGHYVYVYNTRAILDKTPAVSRFIVNWLSHCKHIRLVRRVDDT